MDYDTSLLKSVHEFFENCDKKSREDLYTFIAAERYKQSLGPYINCSEAIAEAGRKGFLEGASFMRNELQGEK